MEWAFYFYPKNGFNTSGMVLAVEGFLRKGSISLLLRYLKNSLETQNIFSKVFVSFFECI